MAVAAVGAGDAGQSTGSASLMRTYNPDGATTMLTVSVIAKAGTQTDRTIASVTYNDGGTGAVANASARSADPAS